jgi:RNA polymerase sigma-70 factor (ECF subfamily)
MSGDEAAAAIPSETQLVTRIREGQTDAEAELYQKFSNRVYYLGLRLTRSPADAEDIRAETFLRVLHAIRDNQLRSASSLAAYILGTARNVLREFLRNRRPGNIDPSSGPEPSMPSHEGIFFDSEVRKAIEETIARLKPRERELLRMHYYEELPRAEIARRSGIAEERVRLVKSRALKHFREIYTKTGGIKKL